jgi:t-SNARE complex subunit (syntaxin)
VFFLSLKEETERKKNIRKKIMKIVGIYLIIENRERERERERERSQVMHKSHKCNSVQ